MARSRWGERIKEVQELEAANNRIFIEACELSGCLDPQVSPDEVTLGCNPLYRYGANRSDAELMALHLADTIKDFLSYAVGCIFGRYSLERPGLILANQGETPDDHLRQVPEPSFMPVRDNVIPLMEGDGLEGDLAERFKAFLRVTFGAERFEENLAFIEASLGKRGKPQSVRDYFLRDFWPHHLKRYRKRPIYWLFSSPNRSFNALIYLHRYRPDTVSVLLNGPMREFRSQLAARRDRLEAVGPGAIASKAETTRVAREVAGLRKVLDELDAWERDVLAPLAKRHVAIDLDEGVKVNYRKLGAALRQIPGMEVADG